MMRRQVEAPQRSPVRQLALWALTLSFVLGAVGVIAIAVVGSMDFGHEDEPDVARTTVLKLAREAYPRWSRDHSGCPRSIDELVEYMDTTATSIDPWGQRYRMYCKGGLLTVASSGEDRIANTADDRWSNR
jgi:hypothetical protein